MTKISSSDLNMIESTLRQVSSAVGGEAGQYINCVWTVGSDIENIVTGDHDQKKSGIQSLIGAIFSWLTSLGANASAKASSDVKSDSTSIDNTSNKSKKLKITIRKEINNTNKALEEQNKIIADATQKIQAEQENVEKAQNEIKNKINEIKKCQEELNSAKTSDEKSTLLNKIAELSGDINGLISIITGSTTIIAETEEKITEAIGAIEEIQGHSIEVQENTETELSEIADESQEEIAEIANTQAEGIVNESTSLTAATAATAATATVVGADVAPKLYKISADEGNAAAIRGTGSVKNIAKIPNILSDIGNNKNLLNKYNNTIGSQLLQYTNLIGAWSNTLEPLITSIGSFNGFSTGELDSAVSKDMQTLKDASAAPKADETPQTSGDTEQTQNQEQKPIELITPTVEIKAPWGLK